MNKAHILSILLIVCCLFTAYGQSSNIPISTYIHPKTGRLMERIDVAKIKTDTFRISNDSVEINCKMLEYKELNYRHENRRTGNIVQITGNTRDGFKRVEKNKNSRIEVEKNYYSGSGKIFNYSQYYNNKFFKRSENNFIIYHFNFDKKGNCIDSLKDYDYSHYKSFVTVDSILAYFKRLSTNSDNEHLKCLDSVILGKVYFPRFERDGKCFRYLNYITISSIENFVDSFPSVFYVSDLYTFDLIVDQETGIVKLNRETMMYPSCLECKPIDKFLGTDNTAYIENLIKQTSSDSINIDAYKSEIINNDSISSTCQVVPIKDILYTHKNKKSKEMLTYIGNTKYGFSKSIDKYCVALYDPLGNVYRTQKVDSVGFPLSICEYDVNGDILKEMNFTEQNCFKFNIVNYLSKGLFNDIEQKRKVTLHDTNIESIQKSIKLYRYLGYDKGFKYSFLDDNLTGNEKCIWEIKGNIDNVEKFNVGIDSNTGELIYMGISIVKGN